MKFKIIYLVTLLFVGTVGTFAQSQKRVHYNDGSYADVIENADGTTTHVHHQICFICKGTKSCTICHGLGGLVVGYINRHWRICTSCGGYGKCKYCNGYRNKGYG